MKYFLLSISLIVFLSCESPQKESPNDLTKEIISVVYMSINNKSKSQIDDFSDYYQKQMKALEPKQIGGEDARLKLTAKPLTLQPVDKG